MKTKLLDYGVTEHLDSDEMIAAYLSAALEENDTDFFISALNNVIRAKGITQISKDAGLGRESLYKVLLEEGQEPDVIKEIADKIRLSSKPPRETPYF